jgi:hypothetical protein
MTSVRVPVDRSKQCDPDRLSFHRHPIPKSDFIVENPVLAYALMATGAEPHKAFAIIFAWAAINPQREPMLIRMIDVILASLADAANPARVLPLNALLALLRLAPLVVYPINVLGSKEDDAVRVICWRADIVLGR